MISLRTFTIFLMLLFMLFQSLMFGASDKLSLFFILAATAIIFNAVLKLQIGNKKALRANAKKDSWLYNILSNEKSIFIKVLSLFASLLFAVMLTLILKGIIINHGYWALFIIIAAISFTIFNFLNRENTSSSKVSNNLQSDIASHANEMLYIVIVALVLNFVLSLLLSAHDTMSLLNSKITFENFEEFALNDAIEKNDTNHYTRLMINLYLLLDYFKLAITTKVIDIIIPGIQDRVNWFYLFYLVVFILNMMKLLAFSLSFVLMQKGMETFSNRGLVIANKTLVLIKKKYQTYKNDKLQALKSSSSVEKTNEETNQETNQETKT